MIIPWFTEYSLFVNLLLCLSITVDHGDTVEKSPKRDFFGKLIQTYTKSFVTALNSVFI